MVHHRSLLLQASVLPPQALVQTNCHFQSDRLQMALDAEMLKKLDAAKMESMVGAPAAKTNRHGLSTPREPLCHVGGRRCPASLLPRLHY